MSTAGPDSLSAAAKQHTEDVLSLGSFPVNAARPKKNPALTNEASLLRKNIQFHVRFQGRFVVWQEILQKHHMVQDSKQTSPLHNVDFVTEHLSSLGRISSEHYSGAADNENYLEFMHF